MGRDAFNRGDRSMVNVIRGGDDRSDSVDPMEECNATNLLGDRLSELVQSLLQLQNRA